MSEPKYRLEGIVHTRDESMEDFEGPLDVIFLLLSKNKIDIEDVSITAILEQYLAYLDEMKRLDMEIASEFITMASHLMLIKTKMLLSSAEAAEAETEMAPKRAFAPTFVTKRAPGSFPKMASTKSTRRLAMPPWFIRLPARMKKGMAVRLNLLMPTKVL